MTALVEPAAPAPVDGNSACDVCGTADILRLGICASCARGDSDALVFVQASERRADREALEAWLIDALGGAVGAPAARDAADGFRPIVGLPTTTAGRAAAMLSMRGVSAVAVSRKEAWKRLPRGLLMLAGGAAGMGLFLGLTVNAAMSVLGPAFAALLILAALRQTREPIWIPEASSVLALPASVETRVRSTLASLRKGRARDRLKEIVAVATALEADANVSSKDDLAEATAALLELSCRAVVDLDQFDCSLAVLDREPTDETDPALAEVIDGAVAARQALVEQLDDVAATLVRAQTVTTDDPAELHRAAQRLTEEVDIRTGAWTEVQRYTS